LLGSVLDLGQDRNQVRLETPERRGQPPEMAKQSDHQDQQDRRGYRSYGNEQPHHTARIAGPLWGADYSAEAIRASNQSS
jgi:hypothetical protein